MASIGNRMIERYSQQAGFAGRRLHAQQVDKAIEKFGFAMGPFRIRRPGGQRHWLGDSQAPRWNSPDMKCKQDGRPAVRNGPFRPEDRRRLKMTIPGKRDAIPSRRGQR